MLLFLEDCSSNYSNYFYFQALTILFLTRLSTRAMRVQKPAHGYEIFVFLFFIYQNFVNFIK